MVQFAEHFPGSGRRYAAEASRRLPPLRLSVTQPLGFREHAAEGSGAFDPVGAIRIGIDSVEAPGTAAEVFPLSFGKLVLLRRRWQRLRRLPTGKQRMLWKAKREDFETSSDNAD
jgi:hypothetical protein